MRELTESRAARIGGLGALVVVVAQLGVGAAWSLTHDDPTELELMARCLEQEKGFEVRQTLDDPVASEARGGTLRAVVQGGLATVSVATSVAEVERLRRAYAAAGASGPRLDIHGRYVVLWHRPPSREQRQLTYDCGT